jgi:hypothetical protein
MNPATRLLPRVAAGNAPAKYPVSHKVLTLLAEVLFSRWRANASRSLRATSVWWIVVVAAGIGFNWDGLRSVEHPLANDQHAMFSLQIAVHREWFGFPSHIDRESVKGFSLLPNNLAMLSTRLRDLSEFFHASTAEYLGKLEPFCNNENSLMLIDQAILRIAPDVTLGGLIRAHTAFKAGCLAAFVFFLLRVGFSPLLALTAFHFALLLIRQLNLTHPISIYPLLIPTTMLFVAVLGLILSFGLHRRLVLFAPAMLAAGFLGAFLINLRSSYAPIVAALMVVCLVMAALDLRRNLHRSLLQTGLLAAAALLCCFAGFKTFTTTFISPLQTVESRPRYTYHVIAHPLVLFLAVPPNDFARREGIDCQDALGLNLAHRMDPSVAYLGKNYDNALFLYYFKLWLYQRDEMANLYRMKFRTAAATLSQAMPIADRKWMERGWFLTAPLRRIAGGKTYLGLFAALAFIPAFLIRSWGTARAFALSAVATVGFLLFLEMGLLSSLFNLTYHSALLFCFLFAGMLCYQGIIDGAFHAVRWCRQPASDRQVCLPDSNLRAAA